MKCGFKWKAPLLMPGGGVKPVEQICELDKNHEDDHRSSTKVIHPNTEKKT